MPRNAEGHDMGSRLIPTLCLSALCLGAVALPAQASETRVQPFALLCDGTVRSVIFNMTGLGTANRFIQGGDFSITNPSGGVRFLQMLAEADNTKLIVDMGFQRVRAIGQFTGFIQVTPNASGNLPVQVTGICMGGGSLTGFATVYFFS
jgi:hypothetical protein